MQVENNKRKNREIFRLNERLAIKNRNPVLHGKA